MEFYTDKYKQRAIFSLILGFIVLLLSFVFVADIEQKHQRDLFELKVLLENNAPSIATKIDETYLDKILNGSNSLWITYSLLSLLNFLVFIYVFWFCISISSRFRQAKLILELAPDAILSVNAIGVITYANRAAKSLFKLEKIDIGYTDIEILVPAHSRDIHKSYREEFQLTERSVSMSDRNKILNAQTKCGSIFPAKISLSSHFIDGQKENIVIVKNMSNECQLEDKANTDVLTGLANRRLLQDSLTVAMNRARRSEGSLSIAIIDIDDFKHVNDRHGHTVGDELLITFSQIIKSIIRSTDCIGRWGGEEFILIMESTSLRGACQLCEKIRLAVENELSIKNNPITISIGVTELLHHRDMAELINEADLALYQAKKTGKNRVESYDIKSMAQENSVK